MAPGRAHTSDNDSATPIYGHVGCRLHVGRAIDPSRLRDDLFARKQYERTTGLNCKC